MEIKKNYHITGMGCAACSTRIEKGISKMKGVAKVQVNLLTNSMMVDFDGDLLTSTEIIQQVDELGYGAEEATEEGETEEPQPNRKTQAWDGEEKQLKKRFWISLVFELPLFFISMVAPVRALFSSAQVITGICIFLVIPILYLNFNFYRVGIPALLRKAPNMDSLIAIGTIAALSMGYFDSAGMILTLVTLGKWMEAKAKGKTTEALQDLAKLTPETTTLIRDGQELIVQTSEIRKGETIVARPGETFPCDGVILKGHTWVDQSSITGESIPVEKTVGEKVVGGTINLNGHLHYEATEVGKDTVLSKVIQLVEEAASGKAPVSRIADKVSAVFVPIVIGIALITVGIWAWISFKNTGQIDWSHGMICGICVLVISCPCALGLATPVAIMVGTGRAAKEGIIVKTAEALENLGKTDIVVFDKTGTVTEGKIQVTDILLKGNCNRKEALAIAAGLEMGSEHPLGAAIVNKAQKEGVTPKSMTGFQYEFGKGIKGNIGGRQYFIGNEKFSSDIVEENGEMEKLRRAGKTLVFLGDDRELLAIFALADRVKENTIETIENIKEMGKEVVLLTGDHQSTAEAIGHKIGISKVYANVLPADKEQSIENFQREGLVVAMIGDGVNDGPAIMKADIGIAIGTGTDVAIHAADLVIMENDIRKVCLAFLLSKATISNIKRSLFWAFFYNCICIPLAAGALYPSLGILLTPGIAAGAMSLSSICVVTNALRLRKKQL